jgi:radical SAM superfamily enzyme YgiQ (UPF0313 family)
MRILLVYPPCAENLFSHKTMMRFFNKKTASSPLGILTVAAMLPMSWEKKFVDMHFQTLADQDLRWADYVFLSAAGTQREYIRDIVQHCHVMETKVVAGGPLFTTCYTDFPEIDHFVLNEAEITLPPFLQDLEQGTLKPLYTTSEKISLEKTPIPLWEVLDHSAYSALAIQYSRGCPCNCDFCDIGTLHGTRFRTKSTSQILAELDAIYALGWRGSVTFVDDNLIGNKQQFQSELLPAITAWMQEREHPFYFTTQISFQAADDKVFLEQFRDAGFTRVIIGIESPHEPSLIAVNKRQNLGRDLTADINTILQHGIQIIGALIVGFDQDPDDIFELQKTFIQSSSLVTVNLSLLKALPGTTLYTRLKAENRILSDFWGDYSESQINYIPRMDAHTLIHGYLQLYQDIYSPKLYYARIRNFLKNYCPKPRKGNKLAFRVLLGFISAIVSLGVLQKGRIEFWKLLWWAYTNTRALFPTAVFLAICGMHYREYTKTLATQTKATEKIT